MRSYQKSFNIKSKKIPNLMETKKPVDPGKKDKTENCEEGKIQPISLQFYIH
jgi:hypothetical protein